jgi:opacity protein-like surface antigen
VSIPHADQVAKRLSGGRFGRVGMFLRSLGGRQYGMELALPYSRNPWELSHPAKRYGLETTAALTVRHRGDAGVTNARGARPCPTGFFYNCEINTNWLATATGRVGYAYWDRLLLYAKGGAAIAQDRAESWCNTVSQPTIPAAGLTGCPSQSDSKVKAGFTVGVGSEFGLMQNVSVKSEIMYFDLGSDRYNIAGIPTDIQRNGFISTVGLHFRFGG